MTRSLKRTEQLWKGMHLPNSHAKIDGSAKSASQRVMRATVRAMRVIFANIFFFDWSRVWEVVDHFAPDWVAPENFDDPVYIVNRGFLLIRPPRLIRPPGDMPSKFSLLSTWHITNVQNDIFTTKYLKLIDTHWSPPF